MSASSTRKNQRCLPLPEDFYPKKKRYHTYSAPVGGPPQFDASKRSEDPPKLSHEEYTGIPYPDDGTITKVFESQEVKALNNRIWIPTQFFSWPEFKATEDKDYSTVKEEEEKSKSKKGEYKGRFSELAHFINVKPKIVDSSAHIKSSFDEFNKTIHETSDLKATRFYTLLSPGEVFPALESQETDKVIQFMERVLTPIRHVLKLITNKSFQRSNESLDIRWPLYDKSGKTVGYRKKKPEITIKFENNLKVPLEFKAALPYKEDILQNLDKVSDIKGIQQLLQEMISCRSRWGVLSSFFVSMFLKIISVEVIEGKRYMQVELEIADHEDFKKTLKGLLYSYISRWAQFSKKDVLLNETFMNEVFLKTMTSSEERMKAISEISLGYSHSIEDNDPRGFTRLTMEVGIDYKPLRVGYDRFYQLIKLSKASYIKNFKTPNASAPEKSSFLLFIYDPFVFSGLECLDEGIETMETEFKSHIRNLNRAYPDTKSNESSKSKESLIMGKGYVHITDSNGNYKFSGNYLAMLAPNGDEAFSHLPLVEKIDLFENELRRLDQLGLGAVDIKGDISPLTLNRDGRKLVVLSPSEESETLNSTLSEKKGLLSELLSKSTEETLP